MINIKEDLKEVKEADLKGRVLDILEKWLFQIVEDRQNFKEDFLSCDNDKYFDDLKDLIGEFEVLEERFKGISVLFFLNNIILGVENSNKFFRDINMEFNRLRDERDKRLKLK